MKLKLRYIEDALREWNARGQPALNFGIQDKLDPMTLNKGDLIILPAFPDRWLIVAAREIDLERAEVTLHLDLIHAPRSAAAVLPENVVPLR